MDINSVKRKIEYYLSERGLEASEWDDLQYPCYAWLRLLELLDPSAAHLRAQHASPGVDEH
jgi:hypothetical protein